MLEDSRPNTLDGLSGVVPQPRKAKSQYLTLSPSPWLRSKHGFCMALLSAGYESQPHELRLQWDTLHRLNVNRTIAKKVMEGYKFVGVERKAGTGRVDVQLQRPDGVTERIEVKGTRQVSGVHLLQLIQYHDEGERIAVAALEETVKPADWFVYAAKSMLAEIDEFMHRFPEEAARVYNPTKELCPSCIRTECPHSSRGKRNALCKPNVNGG